jgi:hypothetical protein
MWKLIVAFDGDATWNVTDYLTQAGALTARDRLLRAQHREAINRRVDQIRHIQPKRHTSKVVKWTAIVMEK